jgi:hypothetical protein
VGFGVVSKRKISAPVGNQKQVIQRINIIIGKRAIFES